GIIAPALRQLVESGRNQSSAQRAPAPVHTRAPAPRLMVRPTSVESPGGERRAAIRYPCDLESSCQPIGREQRADSWPARVGDLSAAGIGLILPRRFEAGTLLVFDLQSQNLSRRLLAHVVHAQQHTDGRWMLGCT